MKIKLVFFLLPPPLLVWLDLNFAIKDYSKITLNETTNYRFQIASTEIINKFDSLKPIRALFVFCIIYFQLIEINSQSIFNPIKATRLSGIGGQSVAIDVVEAFPGNASNLASIKKSTLSFNGESRYAGTGIVGSSILACIKLGSNNGLGLGTVFYGLPEYNQLNLLLGYGMQLSKKISIGTSGGTVNFSDPSRDKTIYGMIQFGIQYEVLTNLMLGVSYQRLLSNNEIKRQIIGNDILIGIKYSVSSLVSLFTEIEKDNYSKANVKVGIEYQMMNTVSMRTGVTSYPQSFSTGIGLALNSAILIDAAFSFHQTIGLTPAIGLRFHLNKSTE